MTGSITPLVRARRPNSSWLTTEYSRPALILSGVLPILIVFPAKIPTGTFHLLPDGAWSVACDRRIQPDLPGIRQVEYQKIEHAPLEKDFVETAAYPWK
ncbi:MAG: hypothetical protein P8185_12315 [Deltaproteobacteria bacterium]